MGFCLSWLGVRNRKVEDILEILAEEWERNPWDNSYESPMAFIDLQNGWHVLESSPDTFFFDRPALISKLSKGTELVVCAVNEPQNISEAHKYFDQQQVWTIKHDLRMGQNSLVASGEESEACLQ